MGIFGSAIQGMFNLFQNERNIALQKNENRKDRVFQLREAQKNRDYNALEAEKQRRFNSSEAELARNFNKEQADLAYQRNSYASQMAQMRAAGVNPALAYSQGNFQPMGNVSASPASGSAASSSASPSGGHGFSPVSSPDLNVERMAAEIDNIKADTKQKESLTEGQNLENKWIDLKNESVVATNKMQVTVGDSIQKMNTKNFEILTEDLKHIQLKWDEVSQRIDLMKAQEGDFIINRKLKEIEARFKTPYFERVLEKLSADTALSKYQVFRGMKLLTLEALNLQRDADLKFSEFWKNESQTAVNNANVDYIDFKTAGVRVSNEKLELEIEPLKYGRGAINDLKNNYGGFLAPVGGVIDCLDYLLGRSVGRIFAK